MTTASEPRMSHAHREPVVRRSSPLLALGVAVIFTGVARGETAGTSFGDSAVGGNQRASAVAGTSGVTFSSGRSAGVAVSTGVGATSAGGAAPAAKAATPTTAATAGKAVKAEPTPRPMDCNCVSSKTKTYDLIVGDSPASPPISGKMPESFEMFGRIPERFPIVGDTPEVFPIVGRMPETFPYASKTVYRDVYVGESTVVEYPSSKNVEHMPLYGIGRVKENPSVKSIYRDVLVGDAPASPPVSGRIPELFPMFGRIPERFTIVGDNPEIFSMVGRTPEVLPMVGRESSQMPIVGDAALSLPNASKSTGNDLLVGHSAGYCPCPSKLYFPGSDEEKESAKEHGEHAHHH